VSEPSLALDPIVDLLLNAKHGMPDIYRRAAMHSRPPTGNSISSRPNMESHSADRSALPLRGFHGYQLREPEQ